MKTNALQRLDQLIEESREIEAQAEKLQAEGPLFPAPPHAVQQFQQRYDVWHAGVLELLPINLRERFEQEWIGPEGNCGSQDFVAEPIGTGPDQRHVFDDRYHQTIEPTRLRYTYPYDRCFLEPLRRQRQILVEAKHHPDIARHGRFHEHGASQDFDLHSLHPGVVAAVGSRFESGHYRDSIFRACTALTEAIKEKSEIADRDGTSLIEHVFSLDKPVLKIEGNEDERKGMMWLFKGALMGLRNPRAHHLGDGEDEEANEALEWLVFLSALMRVIDRAELVEEPSPSSDGGMN